ncbi:MULTISPECIES: ethanolamine ammonia-lyase subunit EutB [Zunongwangia]|uniref:Ethanolamine ammonia-lyase large subunit n=3 Tax=Zunongwangia profunda TaxID=398743 RepID=D5B9D8_ZUNPS|nr:ethanolamine ammonia-lyase subunit EutB [Zunongwangia profunda]ADF52223.1 Ethanolamine ammonia lyase large subunit [Zunongwangia profunda SM-A87]HAJ81819.1 ethanolamine ammonia-lyase subunit EutB [Zunongwangia profunda]|tara:strand:- start:177 stop:1547 length:1371 start_codon:yes stop_codon:yes gene_type:complete
MEYKFSINNITYNFKDLKTLLAKASPERSGDVLAGIAAKDNKERVAAQYVLSDLPLKVFLENPIIPYAEDEVTRLIMNDHNAEAFYPISAFSVGEFRDWLLSYEATPTILKDISPGLAPEMVAAVSKLMRNQDLIKVAQKCEVITKFRNTLGLKDRFSVRLQPNNPIDDPKAIAASTIDGLLYGCGDAVIGINPATDSPKAVSELLKLLDNFRQQYEIPTQTCILSHITTTMEIIEKAPVDLIFQSIGGTQKANESFGINLNMLQEAYDAGLQLNRGTIGNNIMYFETGQGSELSANAHHGVDQQTCEVRAYAVARKYSPLLVNTVVGFIGPEYLYDAKQITRAALEDHFCGKMMGLPMGCDVCYTNHAEADQDDMDSLLTLLGVAGCNYIMGVPGADDVMLNYQSTSFHDAMYLRKVLNKRPAPEFEKWLLKMGIFDKQGNRQRLNESHKLISNG